MPPFSVSDTNSESVRVLIELIVRALVDFPQTVKITTVTSTLTTIFEVNVDEDYRGAVIGTDGRTAESIRVLLRAIAGKHRRRYQLVIIE